MGSTTTNIKTKGPPEGAPYLDGFPPDEELPSAAWSTDLVASVLRILVGTIRCDVLPTTPLFRRMVSLTRFVFKLLYIHQATVLGDMAVGTLVHPVRLRFRMWWMGMRRGNAIVRTCMIPRVPSPPFPPTPRDIPGVVWVPARSWRPSPTPRRRRRSRPGSENSSGKTSPSTRG